MWSLGIFNFHGQYMDNVQMRMISGVQDIMKNYIQMLVTQNKISMSKPDMN